jgi:RNA polymerase sigma-70 factor (ECF subfamily)
MDRQTLREQLPGLRRYARALVGDPWAADDLVQDTLERACSRWHLWRAGSDLRAWLFTVMHNLHANQVRRARLRPAPSAQIDVDEMADDLPGAEAPSDLALDLQRCLLRLPEEQRTVLLLVTLEDLSYEAVANILGIPVGTVMSRLSRARARLREWMDPAESAPGGSQDAEIQPHGTLRRLK